MSRLQKENIIDYVPHNLADYIARSTQCLWKRALLEKHFIVTNVRQQARDSETVTATREATMKSAHQTAESVEAEEETISKTSTTQDTVTSSASSHDTAKMSASSSSSTSSFTSTRSLSATEVSQEEQSQQSKKPSTVVSSQLTTSNEVVSSEGTTGMSSRDSIEASNLVAAKIFFSKSGMVKDTISLKILLSPASSYFPGAQHEVLTVHFAWTSEDRVAHTGSADVSRIHNLHWHL